MGRKLLEEAGKKPQIVMTMPLIEGTDGHLKMSKSYDNYIGFTDTPKDMFGKIMSIPDTLIIKYMKYLTNTDPEQIKKYEDQMEKSEVNPRDIKMFLGIEIIKMFHSEEVANDAKEQFIKVFQKNDIPDDIEDLETVPEINIVDLVENSKVLSSKSEIKRLIKQGGVKIDDEKVDDFKQELVLKGGEILRIGKRNFFKIKIK